jgi:pyruvate/2-oxoacid:ferredoxin oxidoreductase alpha subunit
MANGEKVGLVSVHLYRPFSAKHFLAAVPKTAKRIAVLDRTKEPGATGEPLFLDVKECFYGQENAPLIVGGRYGLGSKDTTPAQILAVYENLALAMPKDHFTVSSQTEELSFEHTFTAQCDFFFLRKRSESNVVYDTDSEVVLRHWHSQVFEY